MGRIRFGGGGPYGYGYGGGGGGGIRTFRRRLKVYSPAFLEATGKGDLAVTIENGDKAVFPTNVLSDLSEILARQQDGAALIFEVTSFTPSLSLSSPAQPLTDATTSTAAEMSHRTPSSLSGTSLDFDNHAASATTSLSQDSSTNTIAVPAADVATTDDASTIAPPSPAPPPPPPSVPAHRRTHIGVLEFSGEQRNVAYLPLWIMRGLRITDGDEVQFVSRSLPPVSFLRLQPTDNSFFTSVRDPKLALEDALRNFTAVTEGDMLHISLLGSSMREEEEDVMGGGLIDPFSWNQERDHTSSSRIFVFKVLEVKPKNSSKAASVVTADCEIQFEKNDGGRGEVGEGGGGSIDSYYSSSNSLSRGVSDHSFGDSFPQSSQPNHNLSSASGRNTPVTSSSLSDLRQQSNSSNNNNEFADPVKLEASIGGAAPVRGVLTHGRGGGGFTRPGRAFFTIFVRDSTCDVLRVRLTCQGGGEINEGNNSASSSFSSLSLNDSRLSPRNDSLKQQRDTNLSRSNEAFFAQMLPDESGGRSNGRMNSSNMSSSAISSSSSSAAAAAATKRGMSSNSNIGGGGTLSSSYSSYSTGPVIGTGSSMSSISHIDLFISCTQTKPSRRVFTWSNFSTASDKILDISQSDPAFPSENELGTRVFYASIEVYSSVASEPPPPLTYTISAEIIPRTQRSDTSSLATSASSSAAIPSGTVVDSKSRLITLASSSSSSSSSASLAAESTSASASSDTISATPPLPPSASSSSLSSSSSSSSLMPRSICSNCQQSVPTTTLAMHEPFCRRNNWRCDVCNAVVQIRSKASHIHCKECVLVCSSAEDLRKHMEVLHSSHKCENGCGVRVVGPVSHERHIRSECDLRQVNCLYCNMPLSYRTRHDHEQMCGGRTTSCEICNKNVVRMKLEMHKASGCSKYSSTPSISSSIRSSSIAASHHLPAFSLDGLSGGGPLGLAAHMLDSVFAAEGGGRGGEATSSSSPRPNPVRLVSSVPYPPVSSRSRDTGDDGSDIEYNYDDDTYNDEEEDEGEDNDGNNQLEEEDTEETIAARRAFESAARAHREQEAVERKERSDAAIAAARSAVSCPSCDRQLPSFDDLTIHLLSLCSKRASQEHAVIVSNLLGEEAVNAIALVEDDDRANEADEAATAIAATTAIDALTLSSSTLTGTTIPSQDVVEGNNLIQRSSTLISNREGAEPLPAVTLPSSASVDTGFESAPLGAVTGPSTLSALPLPLGPPPARRARRMLQCPCCFMIFDSSVNEDDVQVHVLTDCSSPWTDVERALKWIKPAPEGAVATNKKPTTSSTPLITSVLSSSSSSSSLSFAPHAMTSSSLVAPSSAATATSDRDLDQGERGALLPSSLSFPHTRSVSTGGGNGGGRSAADDDISLLLPRHSSRVLSSSPTLSATEFRESSTQHSSIASSSLLRPSLFSSLVEEEDDIDDNSAHIDSADDSAAVDAAFNAGSSGSSGLQQQSSQSSQSRQSSFPLPRASDAAIFNAQCPSCGEQMVMNDEDDMQLHMLTTCPNAEENAKTLFG